jgi:hypothetical protein
MSKFVVVIPNCLPETQNFLTNDFKQHAAWWHWSSDVWLLNFSEEKTAVELRDELKQKLPGVQTLVMKLENQHWQWAGVGPPEWGEWFRECWEKS